MNTEDIVYLSIGLIIACIGIFYILLIHLIMMRSYLTLDYCLLFMLHPILHTYKKEYVC